jgi:MFS family permease
MNQHSSETPSQESCPLLCDEASSGSLQPKNTGPTPVPKTQLATACIIRLLDPIAFTQVFPYINEFMSSLHVTDDPSKIGFFSGLVVSAGSNFLGVHLMLALQESTFAISQLCAIYHWAKMSGTLIRSTLYIHLNIFPVDKIGRRPVILAGATGITITTLLFGLCRSLPTVLVVRFLGVLYQLPELSYILFTSNAIRRTLCWKRCRDKQVFFSCSLIF